MTAVKCPKCSATIDATPDDLGFIVCSQCGAKLRTKTGMKMTIQGGAAAAPARPAVPAPPPPATPGGAGDVDSVLAKIEGFKDPNATLLPGTPMPKFNLPPTPAPATAAGGASFEAILAEIRALRKTQDEILALLKSRPAPPTPAEPTPVPPEDERGMLDGLDDEMPPSLPRGGNHKTVLLIDDDAQTRHAATIALQRMQVSVKTAVDGSGGLAAIAMERPDVIVMELAIGGSMPGKDVINMIKATMEWVDIPVVLYTRLPIQDQMEAREVHGADELVRKGPGSIEALVSSVRSLLAKG